MVLACGAGGEAMIDYNEQITITLRMGDLKAICVALGRALGTSADDEYLIGLIKRLIV